MNMEMRYKHFGEKLYEIFKTEVKLKSGKKITFS